MKIPTTLGFLVLMMTSSSLISAPVAVPGTSTYSQNFDSLTSGGTWVQDGSLPGWWLNRSATLTLPTIVASDGSGTWSANLYDLGAAASPDRALGSTPTGGHGEYSHVVIFTNTHPTNQVRLKQVSFKGEAYRHNSVSANREKITVSYLKADTLAAITGGITPAVAAGLTGYTTIPALDYTTPAGADSQVHTPALETTISQTLSIPTVPLPITVAPGRFIALRFLNVNDGGSDAYMGIDDLSVQFEELNCTLTAGVSGIVRNEQGTPNVTLDDTIDFDLTVNATGTSVGNSWIIAGPAGSSLIGQTGFYGLAKSFVGVPISEFNNATHTLTCAVVDTLNDGCAVAAPVVAPWCTITPSAVSFAYNDAGTFGNLADDTCSVTVTATGIYIGTTYTVTVGATTSPATAYGSSTTLVIPAVTQDTTLVFTDGADAACKANLVVHPPAVIGESSVTGASKNLLSLGRSGASVGWVVDPAARTITQTQGEAALQMPTGFVLASEQINLAAVTGDVYFSALFDARDNSTGTNFENDDLFKAELILDRGLPSETTVNLIENYDRSTDAAATAGFMNGFSSLAAPNDYDSNKLRDEFNKLADHTGASVWTDTFTLGAVIPDSALSAELLITGVNDSGAETYILKSVNFGVPHSSLYTSLAGLSQLDNQGTPGAADDKFSAPVDISGANLGASTRWTSNVSVIDGETTASGLYSTPNPISFGGFLYTSGPKTVTLTDALSPGVSSTFTVPLPFQSFSVSAPINIVRNRNGDNPADDTLSFDVTIAGTNGGPGWTSPGNSPATGPFGSLNLTSGLLPATATMDITISDASYPGLTRTLTLTIPQPNMTLGTPINVVRQENGPGLADDTVTFDLIITGTNGSNRWTATPATPASGTAGLVSFTLPAPLSATGSTVVTISDPDYTTIPARTVTVSHPRYVIGQVNLGLPTTEVTTLEVLPSAYWQNDPALRTLFMSNADGVERSVTSALLDLSAYAGNVAFTAQFIARDSSTGSNFETADTFVAELLLDEGLGTQQTINLITPFDTSSPNGVLGKMNGYQSTGLADYNLNKARDEFNSLLEDGDKAINNTFNLAYTIDDSFVSARLIIKGACGAAAGSSENFTVQNVLFSPDPDSDMDQMPDIWEETYFGDLSQGADDDYDGDGQSNLAEFLAGTNPTSTSDVLRITSVAYNPASGACTLEWNSVIGKRYQVQHSPDLVTPWTSVGTSVPPVTGTTTTKVVNITPGGLRHYFRVKVLP